MSETHTSDGPGAYHNDLPQGHHNEPDGLLARTIHSLGQSLATIIYPRLPTDLEKPDSHEIAKDAYRDALGFSTLAVVLLAAGSKAKAGTRRETLATITGLGSLAAACCLKLCGDFYEQEIRGDNSLFDQPIPIIN